MSTTRDKITINDKYKDRLFCLLFKDKQNILSLYNALNSTDYCDPEEIEITTIEDTIYIKMKNDVSFLIDSYLSLWEQQSTFNPNMPVRGLLYFGNLYDAYIDANELNIYGSKLVKIPTPKYYVFYNGPIEKEATMELRLSDAFMREDKTGLFEWTATMINLNHEKNLNLLKSCKVLSDYMMLIDTIRKYQSKKLGIELAVDMAIDECISQNILAEFLKKHRAEVRSMTLTEFNERVFVNSIREEGREEGRHEAIAVLVESLKEIGQSDEYIISKLMEKFVLKEEDAKSFI